MRKFELPAQKFKSNVQVFIHNVRLLQCFLLGSWLVASPDVEVRGGSQRGREGVRAGGRLGDGPGL